jgi:hypothetical protein
LHLSLLQQPALLSFQGVGHVAQALSNQHSSQRVPHALLHVLSRSPSGDQLQTSSRIPLQRHVHASLQPLLPLRHVLLQL